MGVGQRAPEPKPGILPAPLAQSTERSASLLSDLLECLCIGGAEGQSELLG